MPSAEALDAVTVDAFGTLLVLEDPAARLRLELAARGVERDAGTVRRAFRAEAAYYRPRSLRGHDATGLALLRQECVRVFLAAADADLDAAGFVPAFLDSIVFSLAEGAREALTALRSAGLSLACVANWDVSLHDHLARLDISDRFDTVVASADVGAEKPDPRIFAHALGRLGVLAERALHIGDENVDRAGAAAAGLAFEPVPLATLPERLGL
ncbi:MAG: HAD-IA family hydrolase [Thermoleophilia bacterium]|nr:HAD-IA family hydrolase [Thermoleophilia bacterium]